MNGQNLSGERLGDLYTTLNQRIAGPRRCVGCEVDPHHYGEQGYTVWQCSACLASYCASHKECGEHRDTRGVVHDCAGVPVPWKPYSGDVEMLSVVRELIAFRDAALATREVNPKFTAQYVAERSEQLRRALMPPRDCIGCERDDDHDGEPGTASSQCEKCGANYCEAHVHCDEHLLLESGRRCDGGAILWEPPREVREELQLLCELLAARQTAQKFALETQALGSAFMDATKEHRQVLHRLEGALRCDLSPRDVRRPQTMADAIVLHATRCAEKAALVDGRAEAPTDAEIDDVLGSGGWFYVTFPIMEHVAMEPCYVRTKVEHRRAMGNATRWWAVDSTGVFRPFTKREPWTNAVTVDGEIESAWLLTDDGVALRVRAYRGHTSWFTRPIGNPDFMGIGDTPREAVESLARQIGLRNAKVEPL